MAEAEDEQGVLLKHHHICKFCNKRFPCGRSLGGHMRSHLMMMKRKKINPNLGIVNWKTPKMAESSSTENDTLLHSDDRVCRECGRGFCSWKALFGHMKCHSSVSHSDSEEEVMMKRSKTNMANSSSLLEEVALSLIMLSHSVPPYNSQFLGSPEQVEILEKRTRFQCCTCNKIFHSYQALGGHRANHKRGKGCENSPSTNQTADTTENNNNLEFLAEQKVVTSKKNIKDQHECPICFKIFPSGQALGGHKRSHMSAEAKTSEQPIIEMQKAAAVAESRDFLDLNLPAPTEEDEVDDQESYHSIGFQAWWTMESSHKRGQLVGLLSN